MITLYGATGYTGRLIAEGLARGPARGMLHLAGRNGAKLRELQERLGLDGSAVSVIPLEDRERLLELAKRSKVVLSCAGPYKEVGKPVLEACLEAPTHYLDITGEAPFMLETLARDERARQAGIALVNAVGFDVVPTDVAAVLAARGLTSPIEGIDLALYVERPSASSGTQLSALGMLGDPGLAWVNGRVVQEPVAGSHRRFEFPEPFGPKEGYSLPLADIATLPRSTGAPNARVYYALPPRWGLVARTTNPLLRRIAHSALKDRLASRLARDGEGPSEERRQMTRFACLAEARSATERSTATLVGHDVYGLTAATAELAAIAAAEGRLSGTGALTPTQAIDVSLWRAQLEALGCVIQVSSAIRTS